MVSTALHDQQTGGRRDRSSVAVNKYLGLSNSGGRKKPRNFDSSRLGDLLDKEASRKVVVNGEEMTAEQALIRSMFVNGIKGKVTPQRMALKYREERENAAKKARRISSSTPSSIKLPCARKSNAAGRQGCPILTCRSIRMIYTSISTPVKSVSSPCSGRGMSLHLS